MTTGVIDPRYGDPTATPPPWDTIERLLADLSETGVHLLLVKTLSDREDPGPEYAATRAFYVARGFSPAAELDLFGPENPIQLMSRPV